MKNTDDKQQPTVDELLGKIERQPQSTPAPASPISTAPVCPYCLKTPATVKGSPLVMGNLHCIVFSCAEEECRKVINIQVLGQEQPRVQVPQTGVPPLVKLN